MIYLTTDFCSVFFSDALKISKMFPGYKKGDISQIANFRLIALLTSFEKIINKRLTQYMWQFAVQCNMKQSLWIFAEKSTYDAVFRSPK